MSYANQLTFFCGCIALHSRFVAWSCRRRSAADAGGSAIQGSDTPARYRPKSAATSGGVAEAVTEFIQRTYPLALLQWMGKMIVVVLFIFYTVLSAWGVSRLEESFQLESVIPPESYYSKHLQVRYFIINYTGFAPRPVWGLIRLLTRRSLSRCPSAVAAAKPACIESAAGNRLSAAVACVDHAQRATPTSVTGTFLNSSRMFIVV